MTPDAQRLAEIRQRDREPGGITEFLLSEIDRLITLNGKLAAIIADLRERLFAMHAAVRLNRRLAAERDAQAEQLLAAEGFVTAAPAAEGAAHGNRSQATQAQQAQADEAPEEDHEEVAAARTKGV